MTADSILPKPKVKKLTDKQKAVSNIQYRHSYVCALPGSGKTSTNNELCKNLLGLSNDVTLLASTFTRTAASEIKSKLSEVLPKKDLARVKVATLDACIVNMAKSYFNKKGITWKLLIGGDYYLTVLRIVNELGTCDMDTTLEILDHYLSIPHTISFEEDYHEEIVTMYKDILASKSHPTFDLKSLGRYLIEKMETGEILPYSFTYIIVDEVQDTGRVQFEWIKYHALKGKSVCIGIGDDDQSIYRFSGGLGYENFVFFKKYFDADGYTLDLCFRCAPKILSFASSVIVHNQNRVDKEFNAIDKGISANINIYTHTNIVDDITPYFINKPTDNAILTRNNRLLNDVEVMLINEKVPYRRIGNKGGLFSDYNVVAYVKLLAAVILKNQAYGIIDVISWLGESEDNIRSIEHTFKSNNTIKLSQLKLDRIDLGNLSTSTVTLFKHLDRWSSFATRQDFFLCQKEIVTTLADFFPEKRSAKKVFAAVDFFTLRIKGENMSERVEKIFTMMSFNINKSSEDDPNKVDISTLHSAKGKEWETVWILDVSETSIPSPLKTSPIKAKNNELLHIEDERRLFYVGITRAKKTLNINFTGELSRFLANADLSLATFYDIDGKKVPHSP